MDWPHRLPLNAATLIALGGVAAATAVVAVRLLRKPVPPEERERRRRNHVDLVGRIASGTIIDVFSTPAGADDAGLRESEGMLPALPMVVYQYEICGVSYEASQDLSLLDASVGRLRAIPGMAISVKYDPAEPGNSILASDAWRGSL